MASREEEINKNVRKIERKDVQPGEELMDIARSQAQVQDINSSLANNLEMEKSEAQSKTGNNEILKQAALIGAAGVAGAGIGSAVQRMAPGLSDETKELLGKYGYTGGSQPSKTSQNNSTNTGKTISTTGSTTNVRNTTTNSNITNTKNDIKIIQPSIPMQQASAGGDSGGLERFKAWLTGVFAKQDNQYEVQKKEYRKREWNLNRSAGRMMRRIETAGKSMQQTMDPRNMGSSLGGQLKSLLFLWGAFMIGKVWKPALERITSIEMSFRTAFGLPVDPKLGGNQDGKHKSFLDGVKEFIGIDDNKTGKKTNLIDGIGGLFMSGIDKIIAKMDLMMKDREMAMKAVKFPDMGKIPDIGAPFGGLLNGIKDTFGSVAQYLGDVLGAAFGGSKGMVNSAARKVAEQGKTDLQRTDRRGVTRFGGDSGLLAGGRRYMRESDFDMFGNLRSGASSTLAMSQTLGSMISDKSGKVYTGAVTTGLGQLQDVASRTGGVVIDPNLLSQLGIKGTEIKNLKDSGKLKPVKYKLIKTDATKADANEVPDVQRDIYSGAAGYVGKAKWSAAAADAITATGSSGPVIGAMKGISTLSGGMAAEVWGNSLKDERVQELIRRGVLKLVPADSKEASKDGFKPLPVTLYSLSSEGLDEVKRKVGVDTFDIKSGKTKEKITEILKRQKARAGVKAPLVMDQDFGELETAQLRLADYETKWNALDTADTQWNRASANFERAADTGITWARTGISEGLRYAEKKLTGAEQKENVVKAMKFFMGKGFTKEQAAGIVGNLLRESGMNPGQINREEKRLGYKGYGRGIAQWSNSRINDFKAWYEKKYGKSVSPEDASLEDQLEFAYYEMSLRKVLMKHLTEAKSIEEAADYVLRGFENGSLNGMATPQMMDKTYSRAATPNSYGKLIHDSISYSGAALDTFDKKTGVKEEGLLESTAESIGGVLGKVADWVDPKTDKDSRSKTSEGTSDPAAQKVKNLEEAQGKYQASFYKNMYGAKTDDLGNTYIDNGSNRVYLKKDWTGSQITPDAVSRIVTLDRNGMINKNPVGEADRARILNSTIERLEDTIRLYDSKGTGDDVMKMGTRERWLYIGQFNDIQDFRDIAKPLFPNGINYSVLFSKDGRRVVKIDTDKISYPGVLDGKTNFPVGPELYRKDGWKDLDGKPVSWNPLYHALGIGLTPRAKKAIDGIKLLFGATSFKVREDMGDIIMAGGSVSIDVARRAGLIDDSHKATYLKTDVQNFKTTVDGKAFGKVLGLDEIMKMRSSYTSGDERFWKDPKTGNVYTKEQGVWVGREERGKLTGTRKDIEGWIEKNPDNPALMRGIILDDEKAKLNSMYGNISDEGFEEILDKGYSRGISDSGDYNKWLTGSGATGKIITQSIAGYLYYAKLSPDNSRIEEIMPIIRRGPYGKNRMVKADGTLGEEDFNKQVGWTKAADLRRNPNTITDKLGITGKLPGQANLIGEINTVNKGIHDLYWTGKTDAKIGKDAQDTILGSMKEARGLYSGKKALEESKEFQGMIKKSQERWKKGEREGFILGEGGKVYTKSGYLIGTSGKDGRFKAARNEDIWKDLSENLDIQKKDLYKEWFGAQEDEAGNLYVENSENRVTLDMSLPISKDIRKIAGNVDFKGPEFLGMTVDRRATGADRARVLNDWKKTIGDQGRAVKSAETQELTKLVEINGGNVDKAVQEYNKIAYENKNIQEKQLSVQESIAKGIMDTATINMAIANQVPVDSTKLVLPNDAFARAAGFRLSVEAGTKAYQEDKGTTTEVSTGNTFLTYNDNKQISTGNGNSTTVNHGASNGRSDADRALVSTDYSRPQRT